MEDKEVIKDPNASEGEGEVAENTESENQESTQEESNDESKESEIDYAAELEKERKLREGESVARKKAEDKIVQMKREKKTADENDDDPYGLNELVDERVSATVGAIRSQILGDVIEDELDRLSSNSNERELIKFHYENTIRQSGSSRRNIVADLEKAKLLANHKRMEKESQEAINTAINKSGIATSAGSNQDKIRPEADLKLNPQELEILKRRGIDPKTVKLD